MRGVLVPQVVALPHKGWLSAIGASQGSCDSDVWLLPREPAGPPRGQRLGWETPHPCGHMPSLSSFAVSLFPICWDQVRDQQGVPKSLRPSGDSPSPQAASSTLGQKQRPCPWEVTAGGHGEASPAWPQALSFLVVNYSVCGSACSASAPTTPPLMAKIDGFLIFLGQKAPGHAARGSCLHCTAVPGDRGPNLEGGLSQTYFHHLFT